jgi:O-antigen/teichoic acid export membrane protein
MAMVAGGTIAAQVINFLGFLIATRFLGPRDFGIFGIHIALATPLAILATGRYEAAFSRARSSVQVANLATLSGCLAVLATAAVGAMFWLAESFLALLTYINIPVLCSLLLGQALVSASTQLNNYNRSYGLIATSRIIGAIVTQAAVIVLATATDAGPHALGAGMAFGLLLTAAFSLAGNHAWIRSLSRTVSIGRMGVVAKRYRTYFLYNGPQALASALQETAAIAVITGFFGQAATGIYVLSNRLMRAPISITAESVGRVLQQRFGDFSRNDLASRRDLLRSSILYLSLLAALFGVATWFVGPPIIRMAFSSEWAAMADLIRVSAPYYACYLVASSLAAIPLATGDHKPMSLLGIVGSSLYVGSLAASGLLTQSFTQAFLLVSVVMTVYFSVFVFCVFHFVVRRHSKQSNAP